MAVFCYYFGMEDRISQIENELSLIKQRNQKVEADKAWERSSYRIFSIVIITYIVAVFLMYELKIENYYLNALIPAIGYFLSTQSLPMIKKYWVSKHHQK